MKGIINKKGAFTDLFVFMIMAFIILFISGIFIYIGWETKDQLIKASEESKSDVNYTQVIDETFGKVPESYDLLYWISLLIIIGMILGIFIGSYMITTRPIFFIPYIFISIIAIFMSVIISNVYQDIAEQPELASTFAGFIGSNYIMYYFPIWITVIAFIGAIIMFARMKAEEGYATAYG